MRKLLSIVYASAAALSMLLCLGSIALWVKSYDQAALAIFAERQKDIGQLRVQEAGFDNGSMFYRSIVLSLRNSIDGNQLDLECFRRGWPEPGWDLTSRDPDRMQIYGDSPANEMGFDYTEESRAVNSGLPSRVNVACGLAPCWALTALLLLLPICYVNSLLERRKSRKRVATPATTPVTA